MILFAVDSNTRGCSICCRPSIFDSFLMGDEENDVSLDTGTGDTFDLKIRCYKMAHDKVGTAFPEATAHYD